MENQRTRNVGRRDYERSYPRGENHDEKSEGRDGWGRQERRYRDQHPYGRHERQYQEWSNERDYQEGDNGRNYQERSNGIDYLEKRDERDHHEGNKERDYQVGNNGRNYLERRIEEEHLERRLRGEQYPDWRDERDHLQRRDVREGQERRYVVEQHQDDRDRRVDEDGYHWRDDQRRQQSERNIRNDGWMERGGINVRRQGGINQEVLEELYRGQQVDARHNRNRMNNRADYSIEDRKLISDERIERNGLVDKWVGMSNGGFNNREYERNQGRFDPKHDIELETFDQENIGEFNMEGHYQEIDRFRQPIGIGSRHMGQFEVEREHWVNEGNQVQRDLEGRPIQRRQFENEQGEGRNRGGARRVDNHEEYWNMNTNENDHNWERDEMDHRQGYVLQGRCYQDDIEPIDRDLEQRDHDYADVTQPQDVQDIQDNYRHGQHREFAEEMDFKERLKREGSNIFRNLPYSMKEKRVIYEQKRPRKEDRYLAKITSLKTSARKKVTSADAYLKRLDPIKRRVIHIENEFGSAIASFFSLLHHFIYINLAVSIAVFVFLILPSARRKYKPERPPFHVKDLFTGEGFLEQTELFYGYYQPNTTLMQFGKPYSTEEGYFYTILVSYIFYFVVCSFAILQKYKVRYMDKMDNFSQQFGSLVFSWWEFSITSQDNALSHRAKQTTQLKEILRKRQNKKDTKHKSTETWIIRIVVNILMLSTIAGIGFGTFKLVDLPQDNEYILPLSLQAVMLVFPFLQMIVSKKAEDGSEKTYQLYSGVSRTYLIFLTMIGVVVGYWLQQTSDGLVDLCWETKFGQVLYRILVFYFLIIIVGGVILETAWYWFNRLTVRFMKRKYIGDPVFDISRNTSNLLFSQLITWLAFYFVPIIPIVQTVNLLLMFEIRLISLKRNCSRSPKIWTNSTVKFFYEVISFLSLLLSAIPFVYVITFLQQSRTCGPFSLVEEKYPIYIMTFLQNFFLFLPTVAGFSVVFALVCCWYSRSWAISKQRYSRRLMAELEKDKKNYQKKLEEAQNKFKRI